MSTSDITRRFSFVPGTISSKWNPSQYITSSSSYVIPGLVEYNPDLVAAETPLVNIHMNKKNYHKESLDDIYFNWSVMVMNLHQSVNVQTGLKVKSYKYI